MTRYVCVKDYGDRKIIANDLEMALWLQGWNDHQCASDEDAMKELNNSGKGMWIETLEEHIEGLKDLLKDAELEDDVEERERLTKYYLVEIERYSKKRNNMKIHDLPLVTSD